MPKQDKHVRPKDVNKIAHHLVALSTADTEEDTIAPPTRDQVSMLMAQLGRKGGRIGGKRRLETMSAKERKQAARKAAQARWKAKES